MALHHLTRVPLPQSKIYRRKQNNSVYIYLYTDFFRNSSGRPSNKSVNIGKLDESSNLLVPNDHYYDYFSHSSDELVDLSDTISFDGIKSVGYASAVHRIASELGLIDVLQHNFGQLAPMILSVASYCIREGSVMSYIDEYFDRHIDVFRSGLITSQRTSDLFSMIDEDRRICFFKEWISRCSLDDTFAYDVTSISTYSSNLCQAEFGYNRDHDDLRQINIGMFAGVQKKIPVFYTNYNGSLTDKVNLPHILETAENVGIKKADLVMDGGFFDEARIKELKNSGYTFTVGVPASLDISKKILDSYRGSIYTTRNRTAFNYNYAIMTDAEIFGIKGRMLVGLNSQTKDMMMETLNKDIKKREEELADKIIKKYTTAIKKKRYTDLFEIEEIEGNDYKFKVDEDKVEEISKNYGYFLIFTTDDEAEADDILYYYRQKDIDEKMFYQLKDYMNGKRLHTHQQKTTDGKIFCLFIALIIRSQLQNRLHDYIQTKHYTLEKCLRKLEDIQIMEIKGKKPKLVNALTKEQKNMLQILNLDIDKALEIL